jgi:predicted O-linked N-acetylglucosamine transferase (SPINDLY family)
MTSAPQLLIVAATRHQEDAFWSESLLGRSLARQAHAGYGHCISYAHSSPLALAYNRGLDQASDASVVVFCHDDLWLGDESLAPQLAEALERFDLVGVAGNRRRDAGAQAWWLKADASAWDWPNLVGGLRRGSPGAAQLQTYGPSPAPASLLDGVFLAGRAGRLRGAGLRFDPTFPFHLYDLDFCRSAEQAGLRLGVWPLNLIHASGGAAFTQNWKACVVLYRQKWEPPSLETRGSNPSKKEPGPDALQRQSAIAGAHQVLRQWPQALAAYDAALALEPEQLEALIARALVLYQLKRRAEALTSIDAALDLDPTNATALEIRARLLLLLKDGARAESALRAALAQQPNDVDLLFRLATLVGEQQRPVEAIELWFQLLRIERDHIPALLNSGGLLLAAGQISLASAAYSRVLKQQPGNSSALFGLGQCQEITGEQEAALATYTHALSLQPGDLNMLTMVESLRLGLTLWDDYDARMQQLDNQLEQGLDAGEPVSMAVPLRLLNFPLPLELQHRVAARHASAITAAMVPLAQVHPPKPPGQWPKQQPNPASGRRPLRIGYLSADFRSHPMGGLIHGLFAEHDRSRCRPMGYMLSAHRDRLTESVAQGCEQLRDVSQLSSEAIAKQIEADGIDVLIDLMGYTHQGRPSALALRPASLQLLYLGYPGSLGAPFIDGIVADHWLIPPEHEHGYSEPVLRLPWGFVCSSALPADPNEPLPPAPTRGGLGIGPEQMVFACFNRPDKFDPHRFAAWLEILQAVPGSVLLLVVGNSATQARLKQRAQACGLEPGRLIFAAKTTAARFPDLCRLADLFLDTGPYGAGATGAVALQAGLPLLTCPSAHFVSRMAASLCAAVAMPDLICPTSEAYVERAIGLGRDRCQLQQRRQTLLDPGAKLPLFDTAGWVRNWENLLLSLQP